MAGTLGSVASPHHRAQCELAGGAPARSTRHASCCSTRRQGQVGWWGWGAEGGTYVFVALGLHAHVDVLARVDGGHACGHTSKRRTRQPPPQCLPSTTLWGEPRASCTSYKCTCPNATRMAGYIEGSVTGSVCSQSKMATRQAAIASVLCTPCDPHVQCRARGGAHKHAAREAKVIVCAVHGCYDGTFGAWPDLVHAEQDGSRHGLVERRKALRARRDTHKTSQSRADARLANGLRL